MINFLTKESWSNCQSCLVMWKNWKNGVCSCFWYGVSVLSADLSGLFWHFLPSLASMHLLLCPTLYWDGNISISPVLSGCVAGTTLWWIWQELFVIHVKEESTPAKKYWFHENLLKFSFQNTPLNVFSMISAWFEFLYLDCLLVYSETNAVYLSADRETC